MGTVIRIPEKFKNEGPLQWYARIRWANIRLNQESDKDLEIIEVPGGNLQVMVRREEGTLDLNSSQMSIFQRVFRGVVFERRQDDG